jgi:hypothetical protein
MFSPSPKFPRKNDIVANATGVERDIIFILSREILSLAKDVGQQISDDVRCTRNENWRHHEFFSYPQRLEVKPTIFDFKILSVYSQYIHRGSKEMIYFHDVDFQTFRYSIVL